MNITPIDRILHRIEIEETIAQLGLYIDAKQWEQLEQILASTINVDYVSLFGGSIENLPREQLISRWQKLLTPLKSTQHIITNLHITINENRMANCAADVQATHVKPNSTGDSLWTVAGRYDFELKQEAERWRISAIKLTLLWATGNRQILAP